MYLYESSPRHVFQSDTPLVLSHPSLQYIALSCPQKMKLDDSPTVISVPAVTAATSATAGKKDGSDGGLFGKVRYKFWVLAAILLLAFWSMFTGSVTLKWSTGNFSRLADDLDLPIHDDDLDILEVEEKEKVVRQMWNIYTHGSTTKLPRFWQEAFEAAYEALASDVPAVRSAAVSEIAKLSIRSVNPDPLSVQSTPSSNKRRKRVPSLKRSSQ
ncbi:uncharacterized protein LOC105633774 isoform X2 [Jatropha curcas]|uniref:uncharacterized protein LOC105633774 isoform X2 n=1 Tax=Jatropha curcas TaxID=180498 RepID=UPI0009D7200E|nr:uncharacterized protein LOC105633774 isoform X2 [Jatropha curcas]